MRDKIVYIDSVRDCLNKAYGEGNLMGLDRVLNSVPTVKLIPKTFGIYLCTDAEVVNVVRCRNCFRGEQYDDGSDNYVCSLGGTRKGSDFCSDGERRDENAT